MSEWGEMTFEQLKQQLEGRAAYKFEVSQGRLKLKVDGLMNSLKKMSKRV